MKASDEKPEILVIDDERELRHRLRFLLENAGYAVCEAEKGYAGLMAAAHHPPEVMLLDWRLPDMSGLQVLRRLREWSSVPVLILSELDTQESKVAALDEGADDYLTKPFGGDELLARLRALRRRIKSPHSRGALRFGAVEIDFVHRRVSKHGQVVRLSPREYSILRVLAANPDKVLAHDRILREVWGENDEKRLHYLRVFMMRLRRKLERNPNAPEHLRTDGGFGYRLATS